MPHIRILVWKIVQDYMAAQIFYVDIIVLDVT